MSSTYVIDEPMSFSANNMKEEMPYLYARWGNPTVRQLEEKLAVLEGAEACVAFASGMAASSALLFTTLSHGDHLIMSDTNYAGTAEFARDTLSRMGIEVSPVDTSNPANISNAIRQQTKLVWVETPCNPIVRLADIRTAANIAHDAGQNWLSTRPSLHPLRLGRWSSALTMLFTHSPNTSADMATHSVVPCWEHKKQ